MFAARKSGGQHLSLDTTNVSAFFASRVLVFVITFKNNTTLGSITHMFNFIDILKNSMNLLQPVQSPAGLRLNFSLPSHVT